MCCETNEYQRGFNPRKYAFGCCCGCGSSFRRFMSAKEERERIEDYREQLKKELAAVEEHLKEIKSK